MFPLGGAPNRPLPPTPDEEESDRTLVMKRVSILYEYVMQAEVQLFSLILIRFRMLCEIYLHLLITIWIDISTYWLNVTSSLTLFNYVSIEQLMYFCFLFPFHNLFFFLILRLDLIRNERNEGNTSDCIVHLFILCIYIVCLLISRDKSVIFVHLCLFITNSCCNWILCNYEAPWCVVCTFAVTRYIPAQLYTTDEYVLS